MPTVRRLGGRKVDGGGNFRKAGLFSRTVRGYPSVFSPKLSDECPGRLPLLGQRQPRHATPEAWRPNWKLSRAFFARSLCWRASCGCRARGIISSSADLCAVEIRCAGGQV
jgi:hypothetical protein